MTAESRKAVWRGVSMLIRVGLGALFVYMGLAKALHPEDFLKLIREYDVIKSPLFINALAASLPWFEVFCGVLLVLGVAVRGSALVLVAMLIPFSLLVAWRAGAIASQTGIAFCAVKFDCGCGAGEVFICNKLAENCLLLVASLLLVAGHGRSAALRYEIWPDKTGFGQPACAAEKNASKNQETPT